MGKELMKLNLEIEYLESKKSLYEFKEESIKNIEIAIKDAELKKQNYLQRDIDNEFLKKNLNKVLLGDSIDFLKKIPNSSIDIVVSDIPYGINLDSWDVFHENTNSAFLGKSPAQENKKGFKRRGKPINGWNKEDREINKRYYEWVLSWSQYLFNCVKEGSPVFIFGGRRTLANAIVAMEESGFLLKDVLAWEKNTAHHRSQDIFKVLIKRGKSYKINQETIDFIIRNFNSDINMDNLLNKEFSKWTDIRDYLFSIDEKSTKKYIYEILEYSLNDRVIKEQINLWRGWKLGNLALIMNQ